MGYKYKLNVRTGQFDKVLDAEAMINVKDPVDTYNDLPITGNEENDARFVKDMDKLYVWSIASASGNLTDWKEVAKMSIADTDDVPEGSTNKYFSGKDEDDLPAGTTNKKFTTTEKSKLSGIEESATADQSDAEIQSVAKADTDIADAISKKHPHANKATLDLIEEALTIALKNAYDGAVTDKHTHSNKTVLDAIQQAFTTVLKEKLDGIEGSAKDDQTATEIRDLLARLTGADKLALEALKETDTYKYFTATLLTKLNAIEESATADQTDEEIRTAAKGDTDIADAISKKHVEAHTLDSHSEKKLDTLDEKTGEAGVTVDNCLIKDGKAADSNLLEGSNKATVQDHTPKAHTAASHSDVASSGANIDDAVSKKHSDTLDHAQGTDQKLDEGGANEVGANEILKATTADVAYYIDPDGGSDVTGVGSAGNPFATIQHALDLVPKLVRHQVEILLVDSLNYAEEVKINGFVSARSTNIGGNEGVIFIHGASYDPDLVLVTGAQTVFEIIGNATTVVLYAVSSKVTNTESEETGIKIKMSSFTMIAACKFADSGGSDSKAINVIQCHAYITGCGDYDANKFNRGLVADGGIITYDTTTIGDTLIGVESGGMVTDEIILKKADYDDAITKKHTQGTDQYLDQGGGNQVAVADAKDAVDKKHTSGSESQGGDISGSVGSAQVEFVMGKTRVEVKDAVDKRHALPKSGAGAPTGVTPDYMGQAYVDTTGPPVIYIAHGLGEGDWTQVSN